MTILINKQNILYLTAEGILVPQILDGTDLRLRVQMASNLTLLEAEMLTKVRW